MMSLIEVECPHCGARGQIMVPPVGAIIIGPCPQCKELVVVFCGQVLPLDKDVMEGGNAEERQEHLMSVLTQFLRERIGRLFEEEAGVAEEGSMSEDFEPLKEESNPQDREPDPARPLESTEISQGEFNRFIEVDLKLMDNPAYFKSVFDVE